MGSETTAEFYSRKIQDTEEKIKRVEAQLKELSNREGYELIKLAEMESTLTEVEVERLEREIERRAKELMPEIGRLSGEVFKLESLLSYYQHRLDQTKS